MDPNPVLNKLGFSPTDRLAIIQVDDIGTRQAGVAPYAGLLEYRLSPHPIAAEILTLKPTQKPVFLNPFRFAPGAFGKTGF
jgi:hypothetical protein